MGSGRRVPRPDQAMRAAVKKTGCVPIVAGKNFEARFNGRAWVAWWQWDSETGAAHQERSICRTRGDREQFEKGVERWIQEEWLELHPRPRLGSLTRVLFLLWRCFSA